MVSETISFCCPACGIKLTVPASLAGVVGPCPSCRTQIQAPFLAPQAPVYTALQAPAYAPPQAPPHASPPAPAHAAPQAPPPYAPPQAPTHLAAPASATVQVAPQPIPVAPREIAVPSPVSSPPQVTEAKPEVLQKPAVPAVVRPEPRQLPNRQAAAEVVAKQMPEPLPIEQRKSSSSAAKLPRHPKKRSILARVAMLLMFIAASGALVYGVLKVLNSQDQGDSSQQTSQSVGSPATPASTAKLDAPPVANVEPVADSIPTPAPLQTDLAPVPEPVPMALEEKSPGMEAVAVLEKFLTAKTLDERLPIIETKSPESEIAASILSGPLPPAHNILIDARVTNTVENVVDYFYNVDFENQDRRFNPQTLLVRTRGNNPPMVVVDPFLDLFGGRLAAYAAGPQEKGRHFQVIAYPIPSCSNENIEDRAKKFTLKLRAQANTGDIAEAYFSKLSKIGSMLQDGTYQLSFGTPKACTVMLRWNTEESESYPFLEAIDIKSLDWNP